MHAIAARTTVWPAAIGGPGLLLTLYSSLAASSFAFAATGPGCEPAPPFLAGAHGRLLVALDPDNGQPTLVSGMGLSGYVSAVGGLAYDPGGDRLYASDLASGHLVSVDLADGTVSIIGPIRFTDVRGLALDTTTGNLYGIDAATVQLILIDSATAVASVIGSLGSLQAAALVFDPATQMLYTSDAAAGVLVRIDPVTAAATPAPSSIGFAQVQGLALDPVSGVLYGVDAATAQVITVDRETGVGAVLGELGNIRIQKIEFDSVHSTLYGMESGTGRLAVLDRSTGAVSTVGKPLAFGDVAGLVFDATEGTLLAVDAASDVLLRVNTDTGLGQAVGVIGSGGLGDLAIDPGSGDVYGVDTASGELLIIDKTTGTGSPTGISGLSCIQGLEFDATTAALYGADTCADVLIHIGLPGGTQTSVAPLPFAEVSALTQAADAGRMYGLDAGSGLLFSVDLFAGSTAAIGPLGFSNARALAMDRSTEQLFSVSTELDTILRVDETTGAARTIRRLAGNAVHGLAFSPDLAVLYGSDAGTGQLLRIDARSGDSAPVGAFGEGVFLEGLALHPFSEVLYGADRASGQLVRVDTTTAHGTPVGPFGSATISGLAFDDTGELYGSDDSAGSLFRIDTDTGVATLVGTFGLPESAAVTGLAFHPASGRLLGADSQSAQLVSIDRLTGSAAPAGSMRLGGIHGLEWITGAVLPECRHELRFSIVPRLTPSSSDAGDLPAAEETLACDQPFYLEFWARDEGVQNTGVVCAYADIAYEPERVRVEQITHTDAFDQSPFKSGTDDGAGHIDELGGCHLEGGPNVLGIEPQWACVARVQMMPVDASCSRTCGPATTVLACEPADNESSVYGRGAVAPADIIRGQTTPELRCTCLYDVTGDCLANAADLGVIAPSWRKCAGDPAYDARADFDCSGCFAGGDIGFLATAWLRSCSDPEVVFASCQGCGPAPLHSSLASPPDTRPTVQFALRLTTEPITDGAPRDELPPTVTATRTGQRLFAEFWMRDLNEASRGLVAGFANLRFAPDSFRTVRTKASKAYNLMPSGYLERGAVLNLGGATVVAGAQPGKWVWVASVEFEALQDTAAPRIWLEPGGLEPAARYGTGAILPSQIQVIQVMPLFAAADFNQDGDVDQDDFGVLQRCLTDSDAPPGDECANSDLNGDLRVDAQDVAAFVSCARGPAVSADPGCCP
jgi:DNA-binding beta-propeller fold protein YncE